MSRGSPVSLARAEKIVAQCAGLRDSSMPLIFARGERNWRVTYDAGKSWISIASINDSAKTLRERIAAAMASPRLESADDDRPQLRNAEDFVAWQQAGNNLSAEVANATTNGLTVALVVLVAYRSGGVSLSFPFEGDSADSDEGERFTDIHVPCARIPSDNPLTQRLLAIARTGVSVTDADAASEDELDRAAAAIGGDNLDGLRQDLAGFAESTDNDDWLPDWLDLDDLGGVECAAHVLFMRPLGGSWHCCSVERIEVDGIPSADDPHLVCGAWSQVNDPNDENNYADSEKSLNALFATCRPVPGNPFRDMPVEPRCSCSRYTTDEALEEISDMSESGESQFSAYAIVLQLAHVALDGIRQFGQVQREVFFAGLSELAISVASQANEDALPVVKTAFGEVSVLASGLADELIGYGCDPTGVLIEGIERELRKAAMVSQLWCAARVTQCLSLFCEQAHSKRPVSLQRELYDSVLSKLKVIHQSEELRGENLRSVDVLIRHLRKAKPESDAMSVPEGKRLRSLTSRALTDLCSRISALWHEATYGAYALLPDAGWHSPNDGATWMIEVNDDLPRLLVVHGLDFPEPQITLMPPMQGPLVTAWEKRGCADQWALIAERYSSDVAMMPVGDTYETCGECGCPLPATESLDCTHCPVCGHAVEVQKITADSKAARSVGARFADDTTAARAAVGLGHEFVKWRDDLAATTAWI